jgi:hypothetical protein
MTCVSNVDIVKPFDTVFFDAQSMISPSGKRHSFWKRRHAVSANCATTLFGKLIAYGAQGAEGAKFLMADIS